MVRSFVAEMPFYVNKLRREVVGRETASNKASASKSCACSQYCETALSPWSD